MSKYRSNLPVTGDRPFLTDGGLETTLVFHEGIDLPCFAAFVLLDEDEGVRTLARYYEQYIDIARNRGFGFVLEAPTWRANPDWGRELGYEDAALAAVNRRAVALMSELRETHETPQKPMVISGNIGPRRDGYQPTSRMGAQASRDYHRTQIETFADTDADLVSAFTLNYVEEAIGIALAASDVGMPVVLSYTLETDGRLPSGESLADAILQTDEATEGYPAYYMINCAHPTHFADTLRAGGNWRERIRGLRTNASKRSHAELDESPDLDAGDPHELGLEHRELRELLPRLTVCGGCCGTDHRHIDRIAAAYHQAA